MGKKDSGNSFWDLRLSPAFLGRLFFLPRRWKWSPRILAWGWWESILNIKNENLVILYCACPHTFWPGSGAEFSCGKLIFSDSVLWDGRLGKTERAQDLAVLKQLKKKMMEKLEGKHISRSLSPWKTYIMGNVILLGLRWSREWGPPGLLLAWGGKRSVPSNRR